MPKSSNSVQVSISVPETLLKSIEDNRKGLSRSDYIRQALEESERYKSERKLNGVVYTPQNLAEYVSHKVLSYYFLSKKNKEHLKSDSGILKIIDPACGDGELLLAISNCSFPIKHFSKREQLDLYGIDIDKKALQQTHKRLNSYRNFVSINTNGLCPYKSESKKGWTKLKSKYGLVTGFDIAIANPPWGADVSNFDKLLNDSNFSLLTGQFDTSDLFIESALDNVRDGGFIAFIIPDSLFYQERKNLRKHLITKTKIHFIGRFGEKIFKDVNRACAVVICEKNKARANHNIDCFRLSVEHRNLILSGQTSFHLAESELCHKVEQSRFASNKNYLFNIDIDSELESTYNKILAQPNSFINYLTSSRGVELSKKGNIIQCTNCEKWSPLPSKDVFKCTHCKKPLTTIECKKEIIIHRQQKENTKSLIVGEHISRYRLRSDLWIDISKKGIKYKDNTLYSDTKLVVRKTGIGISASIDYSQSMTNQVVYIFKLSQKLPLNINIELFLALINSRLAFFLITMSNGEIEWKSHPYVTQKQILDFPMPDLAKLHPSKIKKINLLTTKLRKVLKSGKSISNKLDAQLERLVADIYGFKKKDYQSIYKAIDKSQELLSVKALKNISIDDIFNNEAV